MVWPTIFALTMKEASKKKITHSLIALPTLLILMLIFAFRLESVDGSKVKEFQAGQLIERPAKEVVIELEQTLITAIIKFGELFALILVGNLATSIFDSKTAGLLLSKPIPSRVIPN